MPNLFWIVHEHEGSRKVFIQPASYLIFARMKAALAGFYEGEFVEAHKLDEKMTKRLPKKMIGRVLMQDEAESLLATMERSK